jgi:transglutaminase-like putative cysteine protease
MKRSVLGAALLCLIAVGGYGAAYGARAERASRTFQFRYRTVVKEIPSGAGKVEVWLPFPTSDAHQTISRVSIDAPRPITISREPEYGNSVLYVRVDRPEQREIPIELTFTATRREYVQRTAATRATRPLLAAQRTRFLQPDRLVPTDGRIRQLAMAVTKGKTTDLEKARAIYEHVTRSVKYDKSGQGWGRGDALYVCDARAGNCTDFHALIIGMARSVGIPAKFAIGFPLPAQRGSGEIPGYHCWAEVYVRDIGWIPLDSSEASKHPEKFSYFFGAHDENRVQLSVGRDIKLNPTQAGEPLNYFVYPYVEVDGKPHTAVEKQFAFADKAGSEVAGLSVLGVGR